MSLMNKLAGVDGEVFEAIGKELGRQQPQIRHLPLKK